jgi:hypothetical protein
VAAITAIWHGHLCSIYNEPIGAEVTGDNGSFVEEF